MVGIEVFSEYFKGFYESYIVIGGVACEDHFSEEGLDFRVTKDIDLVLVIEALNNGFIARFWEFIELGEYKLKQVGEIKRKYYRFINPQKESFPLQIELFSRKPDIIPQSHLWGLLDKPSLTGEMDGLKAFLNEEQTAALENPLPIEMEKGHATFHHPLLVHGSFENLSDRPRRAFVLNVFADGTRSDTDGELLAGVPVIGKGQKLEGEFFPLLTSGITQALF